MNPAFSVIFFTTLSGTGFGLWCWLGLRIALGARPQGAEGLDWAFGLIVGGVLIAGGVIASLWHLGQPARVWRAFSQWRSAWMSREGVFALASFVPAGALAWIAWHDTFIPTVDPARPFGGLLPDPPDDAAVLWMRIAAAALVPLCTAAVFSTAMIYASLKPIPAWRHRLVVPGYLLFAALGGGLLFGACAGRTIGDPDWLHGAIVASAIGAWGLKRRYWRDLDRDALPHARGDAVGLPGRDVRVFERPHTEQTFLTREMGFVVARKHAKTLRTIAIALFAIIPALCALLALWLPYRESGVVLCLGATAFQIGALVERWLFFAEAKHLVTLYY